MRQEGQFSDYPVITSTSTSTGQTQKFNKYNMLNVVTCFFTWRVSNMFTGSASEKDVQNGSNFFCNLTPQMDLTLTL